MEDYIFLIIAIVLSILGAMNQSKKKRQAAADRLFPEEEERPSIFDQMFADDEVDEEPVVIMQKPEPKVFVPNKQPVIPTFEPAPSRLDTGHIQSSLIKRSIEVKPVEDLEEDAEPEYIGEGIMEGFTLKKALVYTEIIERRY
jgi:hypothetical protein